MSGAGDPTDAATAPALRASDAERERTATLLREHCAAGRLTPEELGDRLEDAYGARTVGDLQALVGDLPADPGPPAAGMASRGRSPAREQARMRLLHATGLALLVSLAAVAIWLATGGDGSFWPKWVMLVSAIRIAFTAWGELGPAAGHDETRLGRGGSTPREVRPPPDPDR